MPGTLHHARPDDDLVAKRIALASNYSSVVDPSWKLDNFHKETILKAHERLNIKGFTSIHGINNYLNVPFGHVPARFMPSRMAELDELEGTLDATLYGPRCPQVASPSRWDVEHDWEMLGCTQRMSEFDCLAANIYVPPGYEGGQRGLLPVLAHIHGGALVIGDAGPEKDGNHMLKRALTLGKPFIFVSLAYRVNLFGFLTSKEIVAEQKAMGHNPILMQGFQDQRIGLQWIHKYIHLFGGDRNQITLSGESAGAVSVWYQLKSKEPKLFKRCIIRSFPPPTLTTMDTHQRKFDIIISKLGIVKDAPAYVKMAALRSVSAAQLVELWDGVPMEPVYDPNWLQAPRTSEQSPRSMEYWTDVPDWVEQVVIGCTRDETALFGCRCWPSYDWKDVEDTFRQSFGEDVLNTVLASRAFKTASSPYEALYAVSSEAAFIAPSIDAARSMSTQSRAKVSVYIIEGTEDHPGPLQGTAPHGADLTYYTYQPGNRQYPEMAATADRWSEFVTSYVHGQGCWESIDISNSYMSFDGTHSGLRNLNSDRLRRQIVFDKPELRREFASGGFEIVGRMFSKGNANAI